MHGFRARRALGDRHVWRGVNSRVRIPVHLRRHRRARRVVQRRDVALSMRDEDEAMATKWQGSRGDVGGVHGMSSAGVPM